MMHLAARMALQQEPQGAGKRRAERRPVSMSVPMRALGYHGCDVIVRNISELGFMAQVRAPFAKGSYVRLQLPLIGSVLARIAWAEDDTVGGEFIHPLSPSQLSLIARRKPA